LISKENVNYAKEIIDDPEEYLKNHVKFIYKVASKNNLPLELVEKEVTSITYEFESKTFKKQTKNSIV
jgi:hypothetical protein